MPESMSGHPSPRRAPPAQRRPGVPVVEYRAAAKLARRVALVTAAHAGVARAAAVLFAREGADLALVYPEGEEDAARETLEQVRLSGGRCLLLPGDTLSEDFCRWAVEETLSSMGRLDILLNGSIQSSPGAGNGGGCSNGGGAPGVGERLSRHLFRSLQMVTAAVDHLRPGSCVINTGCSPRTPPTDPEDSAAQGAVRAFTRSLAGALAPVGIRVNCVDPGPGMDGGATAPSPEDLAPTFVYLAANPDSLGVTGEVVTVRG